MTCCKHSKNRTVPISFQERENFQNMKSDCFNICLITGGYTVLLVDGKLCYLGKDMVLCFEPERSVLLLGSHKLLACSISFAPSFMNVNLNYELIKSDEYPQLCAYVGYPNFSLFRDRNILYNGIMPLKASNVFAIENSMKQIMEQISQQPDDQWSCRSRSFVFALMGMLEILQNQFINATDFDDDLILDIVSLINQNPNEEITLEKLCEKFDITRNALNRRFKTVTGQTVIDYAISCRIKLAKQALAFSGLTVNEIAQMNGFYDHTYFAKVFKKRVGATPKRLCQKSEIKAFDGH